VQCKTESYYAFSGVFNEIRDVREKLEFIVSNQSSLCKNLDLLVRLLSKVDTEIRRERTSLIISTLEDLQKDVNELKQVFALSVPDEILGGLQDGTENDAVGGI